MLEVRQGFLRPTNLLDHEGEAQEAAFAHQRNLAFDWVHRVHEGGQQEVREALHHPLGRAPGSDQDDHVVGITSEAVSAAFRFR